MGSAAVPVGGVGDRVGVVVGLVVIGGVELGVRFWIGDGTGFRVGDMSGGGINSVCSGSTLGMESGSGSGSGSAYFRGT